MRKKIEFGKLSVGDPFYRSMYATAADKKIEPVTTKTGVWNGIGVDDGVRCRVPDTKIVYVDVEDGNDE